MTQSGLDTSGWRLQAMVCLTVFPSAMVPFVLYKWYGVKESLIVIFGLCLMLASSLVKINYYYNVPMSEYQYYAGSVVFYAATLIAETAIVPMAVKTIPPKMATSFWHAGMIINTADTCGRLLGNVWFTIYAQFDKRTDGRMVEPFYAYIVNSAIIAILLVITSVVHKRMKQHMEIEIRLDV